MSNYWNKDQHINPKKEILLSVIIATYNGGKHIGRCLDSFTRQSIKSNLFEVITVNNNSTDDTQDIALEYVNHYDHFFLLEENSPGVSYARNKGILNARGKYICFIDDDAYADKDWLKNVLSAFTDNNPEPAVVGGCILPYYNTQKPEWFSDKFEIRAKGSKSRFLSKSECYSGFPESNLCIRKEVLDKVGHFSIDFGPRGEKMGFGEGSELSRRITDKFPHFWYDPDIIVYHLVPERNMSVKYILSRKYKTAYLYQALITPSNDFLKNGFTFSTCLIRIIYNALLSILLVRWFTKKMIQDWLKHAIPLVNCTARSLFIMKYYFGFLGMSGSKD